MFAGAERCVPLLSGVSDVLNFKLGRLYYWDNLQETETLKRSVDWIVHDLRVTDYEISLSDLRGDDDEGALLPTALTHDSVRATAEYLYAHLYTNSAGTAIFERLFGLLHDITTAILRFSHRDYHGTAFAEEFIRRFIPAINVSRVARSVSILQWFKPHNYLPEMCVDPRERNVDAPPTRTFDELRPACYEVQKSDLYVFVNSASGKELQLFTTTARAATDNDVEDLFVMTFTTD